MNAAFYRINNLSDDYSFVTSHHYSTLHVGVCMSGHVNMIREATVSGSRKLHVLAKTCSIHV